MKKWRADPSGRSGRAARNLTPILSAQLVGFVAPIRVTDSLGNDNIPRQPSVVGGHINRFALMVVDDALSRSCDRPAAARQIPGVRLHAKMPCPIAQRNPFVSMVEGISSIGCALPFSLENRRPNL